MSILNKILSYLHRDAVAVDQAANVVIGGQPDETISTHAQIAADSGNLLGEAVTDALHVVQKDHGKLAEAGDEQRAEQEIARIKQDEK